RAVAFCRCPNRRRRRRAVPEELRARFCPERNRRDTTESRTENGSHDEHDYPQALLNRQRFAATVIRRRGSRRGQIGNGFLLQPANLSLPGPGSSTTPYRERQARARGGRVHLDEHEGFGAACRGVRKKVRHQGYALAGSQRKG